MWFPAIRSLSLFLLVVVLMVVSTKALKVRLLAGIREPSIGVEARKAKVCFNTSQKELVSTIGGCFLSRGHP